MLKRQMRRSPRYLHARKSGKSEEETKAMFERGDAHAGVFWQGPIDTLMSPLDSIKYHIRLLECGLVVIAPGNGEVKAWIGGIDYDCV